MGRQLTLFDDTRQRFPWLDDRGVVERIAARKLMEAEAEPPVDIDILASVCGIETIEFNVQEPAGMLFARNGGLVASLRAGDGLERLRFTALHEAGHTFQHGYLRDFEYRCAPTSSRKNVERKSIEVLSDIAAAEMLLPRSHFVPDLANAEPGLAGVEELAGEYCASVQATAVRQITLSPTPVALLVFRMGHRAADRGRESVVEAKLRLQWVARTGPWPFFRRNKSVELTSTIGAAWAGEPVAAAGEVTELCGGSLGTVWIEAKRYGDNVLALLRPLGVR